MKSPASTRPTAGKWKQTARAAYRRAAREPVAMKRLALVVSLGLLGVYLFQPLSPARISIDVVVSSLTWQNAGSGGPWSKFEIAANDSSEFMMPAASILENHTGGAFNDTTDVRLLPVKPFGPVRVGEMVFPPRARLRLTQSAPKELQLAVAPAGPPDSTSVFGWQVTFLRRLYQKDPGQHSPDTLGSANAENDEPRKLLMEKHLRQSDQYLLTFTHPHPWKSPTRLLATDLEFSESDLLNTEAVSSILEGQVRILDTNDPPIALAERDVLTVQFTEPVELYLKGTPAGIGLHVEGQASRIFCGPKIMASDNDRRPRIIKYLYDKYPYVGGSLAVLLLMLLPWVWPNLFTRKN